MKKAALVLPGERRIQAPHFAPIDIAKYVYPGLHYHWMWMEVLAPC